jgi:hypothetical protein
LFELRKDSTDKRVDTHKMRKETRMELRFQRCMRYTMKGSKRMVPCFDFRACLSTMLLVVILNRRHCLREWGDRGRDYIERKRWRTRGQLNEHGRVRGGGGVKWTGELSKRVGGVDGPLYWGRAIKGDSLRSHIRDQIPG